MSRSLHSLAADIGRDWQSGPYYEAAEAVMDGQWQDVIWPLIRDADFSTVLELAPGRGRNTAKLLDHAGQLIAVDINQSNLTALAERFRGEPKLRLLSNNGSDLRTVAGASVTFAYCWDAMVHFDSDVVRSYVRELRRVLRPGALAFVHYSNDDRNPQGGYFDHPAGRNFMSRRLFEHWLAKEGFDIVRSLYLRGVGGLSTEDHPDHDAITLFRLPVGASPGGSFAEDYRDLYLQRREEAEQMRRSLSWKVTAPLRWLRAPLRAG